MKIFLDPGHNHAGGDKGATGYGLKEQDVTFTMSERVKAMLESYGHTVKMSRNAITDSVGNSVATSISQRAKMANEWGADVFISIHCNAFNTLAHGTETLVYHTKSNAYSMAQRIQKNIVKVLGTIDRGVKERRDLGVLKRTNMPALLVETAFIDNQYDNSLLQSRIEDFAKAICHGIMGDNLAEGKETVLTSANDIAWELGNRYITIDDMDGFVKALSEAKENNSPLYWGYRKLVNKT